MRLITLEHGKLAYRADFVVYGALLPALAALVLVVGARPPWLGILGIALAGLASWTLAEYLLHRFILHGLQPFKGWHTEHHRRPTALIGTPTLVSAALIFALAFLPMLVWGSLQYACALSFGICAGYFAHTVTHHADHHWRAGSAWAQRRKRRHALHHHPAGRPCHYGVTSSFWDHVFGTGRS